MIGEVIKGGARAVEDKDSLRPSMWPCWGMEIGDLWIVPDELDAIRVQQTVGTYPHSQKPYRHLRFKTKTIDGKLHVWRKS